MYFQVFLQDKIKLACLIYAYKGMFSIENGMHKTDVLKCKEINMRYLHEEKIFSIEKFMNAIFFSVWRHTEDFE